MKLKLLLAFVLLPTLLRAEAVEGLVLPFKQVSVSSPVLQEVIKDIQADEGDRVRQGQVLANLRNDREELDVKRCENLIQQAQFQYDGVKKLADENLASKESALEKLTDLQAAKLQCDLARVALEEKTIRSPLDGTVVKRYKEVGESVDRTEKMFDIVNIDRVYVQFYLDPKMIGKVTVGDKLPVHFPTLGTQVYEAAVSFVDPRIDAASGLFRVKLLLDNPNHDIKAGMRGDADFAQLEKTAAR